MTEDDVPIFMSVWEEWEARTGAFAKFALDRPVKVIDGPVEIRSAGPAAGDLAGPGTSAEVLETPADAWEGP
jgi:hypothetical protein